MIDREPGMFAIMIYSSILNKSQSNMSNFVNLESRLRLFKSKKMNFLLLIQICTNSNELEKLMKLVYAYKSQETTHNNLQILSKQ